jgi:hypothetical protein
MPLVQEASATFELAKDTIGHQVLLVLRMLNVFVEPMNKDVGIECIVASRTGADEDGV